MWKIEAKEYGLLGYNPTFQWHLLPPFQGQSASQGGNQQEINSKQS
jgi:hypothetical protein